MRAKRLNGVMAVLAVLLFILSVTGCATVQKSPDGSETVTKTTFEQYAFQALVAANEAYLAAQGIAVDLKMAGTITEEQFAAANEMSKKIVAAKGVAKSALTAYVTAKEAGQETADARAVCLAALAKLAADGAKFTEYVAVLSGGKD